MTLDEALQTFIDQSIRLHQSQSQPLQVQYDSAWPSPCYQTVGEPGDWVEWRPIKRQDSPSFDDLESALEISLQPELKRYFSAFWSENLNASTGRGNLQLLLPWNEEDFGRYLQNLVGHVLMKRRLGQELTLFFAVTDEEDFILTVHNQSGAVMLEQVGLEPKETLAPSLTAFIQSLTPELAD